MPKSEQIEIKSKNIKFCAFLMFNDVNPTGVNKFSRGKGEFIYMIEQERWDNFKILFNNSEFIKYSHCLEAIKDLCY